MYGTKGYAKIILIITVFSVLSNCGKINFKKKNIPDEAISLYLSAKNSYEKGDFSSAASEFKEIYQKYPAFYQAGFMYGKSQFFLGNTSGAGLIFKNLYGKFPGFTDAGFWQARVLFNSGQSEASGKLLKKLLSFQPDNPEILYQLALISLEKNRIPDALSFLKKASLFGDRFALVYFQLGRLYHQLGLMQQSAEELSRAEVLLTKKSPLYNSVKLIREKVTAESK
ncbi:MAG: hypothetical protein GXP33_02950 [Spirochaetes bacterium]|nr:hypothetical protein [Spirochaetota bacterium]